MVELFHDGLQSPAVGFDSAGEFSTIRGLPRSTLLKARPISLPPSDIRDSPCVLSAEVGQPSFWMGRSDLWI
jgi:hypothetical protein